METRLIELACFRLEWRLTRTKSIVNNANMKTAANIGPLDPLMPWLRTEAV